MATIFLSKIKSMTDHTRLISFPVKNILGGVSFDYDAPVTPNPLPQNDDTQNILIKIEGNSAKVTLDFLLFDNGNTNILVYDSSLSSPNNTFKGTSAKTIFDQLQFFDAIQPKSINDVYMVEIADSLSNNVTTPSTPYYQKIGVINKMTFGVGQDNPVNITAHIEMMVGNVVTAYEAGTPSQPTAISSTSASSGQATVSWTAPADNGGSAVTHYIIYKRTATTSYDNGTTYNTSTSQTITGLTSGQYYTFKVQAQNANGLGTMSDETSVLIT